MPTTPQRGGEYVYSVPLAKEEVELLESYIKKHKVKNDEPIIQVGERALTKIFDKIADVYKPSGQNSKPRLVEVYYAGIGKE